MLASLLTLVAGQPNPPVRYPPGCESHTFPNSTLCLARNWDLGPSAVDPCAPLDPVPVSGQQVYIQDPLHFCIILPDPNSPTLKRWYYDQNQLPTIVAGEGYVQSFCVGEYLTPGGMRMPNGSIRSAHVVRAVHPNGKRYIEVSGTMDCGYLNINCTGSSPTAYDDGGQYDNVSVRNCGKEPFSGVDASRHPGMVDYVEQAGNGIINLLGLFCMRICEAGLQLEDPCNVKNDTAGCHATMGIEFREGFTYTDRTTGETRTYQVSLPPPKSTTVSIQTTAVGPNTRVAGSVPTSTPNTSTRSTLSLLFLVFIF